MKGLEASPEGRDPLGANRDQRAALEFPSYCLAGAHRRGALAALYVQSANQRAQPAHDRPAADFRLGDESRGEGRVDHEDVEPGNVIEREHAALGELFRCVLLAHRHRQDREQRSRPAALLRILLGLGEFRVTQPGDGKTAHKMQRKPCQANQAQRNRSAVVGRHRAFLLSDQAAFYWLAAKSRAGQTKRAQELRPSRTETGNSSE